MGMPTLAYGKSTQEHLGVCTIAHFQRLPSSGHLFTHPTRGVVALRNEVTCNLTFITPTLTLPRQRLCRNSSRQRKPECDLFQQLRHSLSKGREFYRSDRNALGPFFLDRVFDFFSMKSRWTFLVPAPDIEALGTWTLDLPHQKGAETFGRG